MTTPSGPGQFSQRTDKAVSEANRQLPNADYGEQASYQEQQGGAPMAQSGMDFASLFGNPSASVVGLGEPSQRPDEPVTEGAASGPGAGSEVLANPAEGGSGSNMAYLRALEYIANQPGTSDAARNMIRNMKYSL